MIDPPFMTFPTAAAGLAAEMEMLGALTAGASASAFLWQAAAPGLVLPERFARRARFAEAAAACAASGWPVTTRRTGGGITPQGPGVLNLALAFRPAPGRSRSIRDSYAEICQPMADALAVLGIDATATAVSGSFCDGDYNLAVAGRKLVGTAQRWRGGACLAHALILTEIALDPAVSAVQQLATGLGLDQRFDAKAHCRLADLMTPGERAARDITFRAARAFWQVLASRGYRPFAPSSASARP